MASQSLVNHPSLCLAGFTLRGELYPHPEGHPALSRNHGCALTFSSCLHHARTLHRDHPEHTSSSLVLCCIILLLTAEARAGNGKISGSVTAEGSGQPLQASVEVLGTRIGTVSDSAGLFVILNVPPGSYSVRAAAVGWAPVTFEEVILYENQILSLNFILKPQEIVLSETVVESHPPAIDPSKTSAWRRFDTEDFNQLPVSSAAQVVALSAASFGESVRGGRAQQTVTIVDGIDITDKYAARYGELTVGDGFYQVPTTSPRYRGAALLEPSLNSIDQGGLYAGAWGAEYGGVSGAVSYALKEGRGRWTGSAYGRISQLGGLQHLGPDIYNDQGIYAAEKAKRATSPSASQQWESTLFTWVPGKYSYGDDPDIEGGLALGGPLWTDAGIYLTGQIYDTHGRLPGFRFRQFNGSLKFNASPWNSTRLNITALLEDRGRLFGWKNRAYIDQYRYYLEAVPCTDGLTGVGGLKFTQLLGPKSFYEIQLTANYRSSRTGYCDDNGDGKIALGEHGTFLTWEDTAQVNRYQATSTLAAQRDKFFAVSGVWDYVTTTLSFLLAGPPIRYKDIATLSYSARALFSSSFGPHHVLTAGARATFYEFSVLSRQGGGLYPTVRNYVEESWTRQPREFSVYIEDQMEYAGMIVNAGLRADLFDQRSGDYLNWYDPVELQSTPSGISVLKQVRGENVPPILVVSPRLGVSHPVSENMAVHFSMSIAHDLPPYSLLFTDYRKDGYYLTRLLRVGQDLQSSTSYDFGVQWAPVDGMAIDINAYLKDYQNYFSADWGAIPVVFADFNGMGVHLWMPVLTSHGSVLSRGLEITLRMRRRDPVSFLSMAGHASYTYSFAKAGAEVGMNQTQFSPQTGDSALYGGSLPFDQLDQWNKTFVHIPGGASTSLRGYDRRHRFTCSGVFYFPADLSLSLTGQFASGFYYPLLSADSYVPAWDEGPWNKQIDFRLEKGFALGANVRFSLYADLINAFNWVNIVALVENPNPLGTATQAFVKYQDPTGGPMYNRPVTTNEGSFVYGVPREVYFGARLDF